MFIRCQVAGFTVVSALALWSYVREGASNHAGIGGGTATGSTLTLNSCVRFSLLPTMTLRLIVSPAIQFTSCS